MVRPIDVAPSTQSLYLCLLCLLALERAVELVLSRRNAARALARGAVEVGEGHLRAMKIFHAAFLAACALEVVLADRRPPGLWAFACLAGALAAQALRYWAVATLGDRWNVRVLVVPGEPPVTKGPYRFLRHPNYLAVVVELFCVPCIHGAFLTAILFSLANAALLWVRIREEERALGDAYQEAFADLRRLVPTLRGRRGRPAPSGSAPPPPAPGPSSRR